MGLLPGLELELDTVNNQLVQIVDDGACNAVEYSGLWLTGDTFPGNPGDLITELPFVSTFALFYPEKAHRFGGYLVSCFEPGGDFLEMMQKVQIDQEDLRIDSAANAAIRARLAESTRLKGGLLAEVSERCESLRIPLGAVVLWQKDEDSITPEFASFHSVSTLPPDQALNAMKFAMWERTHE